MNNPLLPLRSLASIQRARFDLDPELLELARPIVDDVRLHGDAGLLRQARRFGDLREGDSLYWDREALEQVRSRLCAEERELLVRVRARVERFAEAQRASLSEFDLPISGGRACQRIAPVERAGCYAPGGRHPLPSSVLMTAVTARAAGVKQVIVASPRPAPITLAAAAEAGADLLVAAGGAQAVAALAFGTSRFEPCDIVVGPGNRWVNAAKALVTPWVAIDSLAGPSELVVVADASADPALVAADLLAQAEHDDDARCVLIALDARLVDAVRNQLLLQLEDLPTAATAAQSLLRGSSLVVESAEEAACAVDALAPEHVQLLLNEAAWLAQRLRHYGALFLGRAGAEVLGDYGSGPNHVLPTGGAARRKGGLSVLDFLRVRTWLELEEAPDAADASQLARLEGLEAHARAADRRVRNVPASASTEGIT